MSISGPHFHAWCDEVDRLNAFAATLSVLVIPDGRCTVHIHAVDYPGDTWRDLIPVDDVIALTRVSFTTGTCVCALPYVRTTSENISWLGVKCVGEGFSLQYPISPLEVLVDDRNEFLIRRMDLALGSASRSAAVDAAVLSIQNQVDTEDILLCLCAPDDKKRVTMGACSLLGRWGASLETCATYHAEAATVACDLALSWVHLHDGDKSERAAGLSFEALAARVEAAPQGARVGVATTIERLDEHLGRDRDATKSWATRPARPDLARKGPRPIFPGDEELTREQVLQAIATPQATLLEALEAAAVPDDEWRAAEPLALEAIEAKKQGAPTIEIDVSTGKHRRFIEHHAPYHVRRLPNGGVLLATHPYRTLWQLWADALLLLGIRS